MKKSDKINFLCKNHFAEFTATRQIVEDELSSKQSLRCVCGALATGFHESRCKKFQARVESETIKKLNHLFKN